MASNSDHLERLRAIVQDSLGKHLYENAIFFADKLVTLSNNEPDDVYRLVQAYMYTKQHRRALHVLHRTQQATASSRFRYLTAKCLAECLELDECLATLDEAALQAVSEETARTYTKRLLQVLNVHNRLQAVLKGMRCGMVQL